MPNVSRAMRTERSPIRFTTPHLEVETRSVPASVRSRETRQDVGVGSVAVPRAHVGADTDALDWRSDPHLLAILARAFKREREAREKDQFRRVELDQPALRAGAARRSSPRLGGKLRTDMSPLERRG
jgi:hypothetical protein